MEDVNADAFGGLCFVVEITPVRPLDDLVDANANSDNEDTVDAA